MTLSSVFIISLALLLSAASTIADPDRRQHAGHNIALRRRFHSQGTHRRHSSYAERPSALHTDGQIVYTKVTLGKQSFNVTLDTASGPTWLIGTGFKCDGEADESMCGFGPTYTPDESFHVTTGEFFEVNYGSGAANGTGIIGNDTLKIDNIVISSQEIGVLNASFWNGSSDISGIMGLAYPDVTDAYSDSGEIIQYSSVMNTIFFVENLTEPIFSLALTRNAADGGFGGYFSIGPTPDVTDSVVNASSHYAHARVQKTTQWSKTPQYEKYFIRLDGLEYAGKTARLNSSTNLFLIAHGNPLNYVPAPHAAAINVLFSPPATLNDMNGMYYMQCNASAPRVGFVVGGETFPILPSDLVSGNNKSGNGSCVSGIQDGGPTGQGVSYVLGDVFRIDTLVVFDLGKQELRISAREHYPIGN